MFEKLGNSLGAMGFLIDMLSYQRSMARKLFVYDEAWASLRILMGRRGHRADDAGKRPSNCPSWMSRRAAAARSRCRAQPLPVPQDAIVRAASLPRPPRRPRRPRSRGHR